MKFFRNKEITVTGEVKKVGDFAPNFKVFDNKFEEIELNNFKAPYIVINSAISLDSTICDIQAKTINKELDNRDDLVVLTITSDNPLNQGRWLSEANLPNAIVLSDYLIHDFAKKYGAYISDYNLDARSVLVLDKNRNVIYVQYVDDMSQHLDIDALLSFINSLTEIKK